MKSLILIIVFLSTVASAQAIDSLPKTSKWQISNSIRGNQTDQVCTFTVIHDDLTGSCRSEGVDLKITGKVDGKKIFWTYKAKHGFISVTVVHDGTFDSSKIQGTVKVNPFGVDGSFTAIASKGSF